MNQQVTDNNAIDDEAGISLAQVIEFLTDQWQRLLLGAVVGLVLGVGGWAALGSYKAESVLINNGAINFLSWRNLQKNLPILAAQMVSAKEVAPGQESVYNQMSSAAWWQKNVVPTYSLSKSDTKDLAGISKELQESSGSSILNLVVTSQAGSREAATTAVAAVTRFIQSGSAYLSVKTVINGYETEVLNVDAELQKKIADAEIDLKFLRQRAANLELLKQRFPNNVAVSTQQVVDLKDSSAKFMPITTQLVAVNTDINNALESLTRMREKHAQLMMMRTFLEQARQILAKENDGLKLVMALLELESTLRKTTEPTDANALQALNQVQADLVTIRTQFTRGLDVELTPLVTRSGPMAPAAGGLLGGAILMLLVGLGQRFWAVYKSKGA